LFSVGALVVGIGAGDSTAPFLKDGIHKHVAEPLTGKEK
jgi:hypothetical protein